MNVIYKCISLFSTKYPILTVAVCAIPSIVSTLIIFLTPPYGVTLSPSTVFDYYVWDDPLFVSDQMRRSLRQDFKFPFASVLGLNLTRTNPSKEFSFVVMFHANGPNPEMQSLFTPKHLAAMKRAEDLIYKSVDYISFCFLDYINCPVSDIEGNGQSPCTPPLSALNHPLLYGLNSSKRQSHSATVCSRKDSLAQISTKKVTTAFKTFEYEYKNNVSDSYNKFISWNNGIPWLAQSNFIIATPFSIPPDSLGLRHEQLWWNWMKQSIDDATKIVEPDLKLHVIGQTWALFEFGRAAQSDMKYVVVSVITLFFFLYFHAESLFLASFALGQVVSAFPVAYIVYSRIIQIPYFSVIHFFVIFLVLGISADDVFVLTDSWRMCDDDSWLDAIHSVTITSFTTALAFSSLSFSDVMPLSTAGIWASTLMIVQYLFVCTAYPCALTIWSRYICKSTSTPSSQVTTTGASRGWIQNLPAKLQQIYVTTLIRRRVIISIIAGILSSVILYLAMKVEIADKPETFFPPSHSVSVSASLYEKEFAYIKSSDDISVSMTWGLSSINREHISYYLRNNTGHVHLNRQFDLSNPDGRGFLKAVYELACRDSKLVDSSGTCRSWIHDFEDWHKVWFPKDNIYSKSPMGFIHDVLQFTLHSDIVRTGPSMTGTRPYLHYLLQQNVLPSKNLTRFLSTEFVFKSSVSQKDGQADIESSVERWRALVKRVNDISPTSVGNATLTGTTHWIILRTKKELARSLWRGTGTSLCAAFIILTVGTRSLIIGTVATCAIGGIVCGALAGFYLLGWKLGISECLIAIVTAGYSFDGVAHYANCAQDGVRNALRRVGRAVLYGAISTAGSSLVLVLAEVAVLKKLSLMVLFTVSLTVLYSLVLLPAVLSLFGKYKLEQRHHAWLQGVAMRLINQRKNKMRREVGFVRNQ